MIYPLSQSDLEIKSKSGKRLEEITIDEVINGNVTGEDITISKETLLLQGKIAEQSGREQLGKNLKRASELVSIPDDELLKIYNMLRPYRSTELELLKKANELKEKYNAMKCSELIMDALKVYKRRGILKK